MNKLKSYFFRSVDFVSKWLVTFCLLVMSLYYLVELIKFAEFDKPSILLVAAITSLLFSLVALMIGCIAIAICVGLKNSTHNTEWVPVSSDDIENKTDEELTELLNTPGKRLEKDENFMGVDEDIVGVNPRLKQGGH